MTRSLFVCDGADVPRQWDEVPWDKRGELRRTGSTRDVNLRLENLSHALLREVSGRQVDLLTVATYVYAADQSISRGGQADVYGRHWRRHISLCIPVSDPGRWNADPVRTALKAALGFLSDDVWDFSFSPASPELRQLTLNLGQRELFADPEAVVLFSGGIDSLCAAVEAVPKRPLLASHSPDFRTDHRQERLVTHLRTVVTPAWDFPHVKLTANRIASTTAEPTQRSRAFLFASLGAAIAAEINVDSVYLSDNGITSLNIPINAQLASSLATRSTHPLFLWLFNRLLKAVLDDPPRVTNSLWDRTRAEVLTILEDNNCVELLQETVSCAHTRGRPAVAPQCGICSQCLDRRFAVIDRGLGDHDLVERYEMDAFTTAIPEGPRRSLAESYVAWAFETEELSADEWFGRFPQLNQAIMEDDPEPSRTGTAYVDLLRRQAATIHRVMAAQIRTYSDEVVAGHIPTASLLGLRLGAAAHGGASLPSDVILSTEEQAEFDKHGFKCHLQVHLTGQTDKRGSNIVVVGGHKTRLPQVPFEGLLRLVVALCRTPNGFTREGFRIGDREGTALDDDALDFQAIARVRERLAGFIGELDPQGRD